MNVHGVWCEEHQTHYCRQGHAPPDDLIDQMRVTLADARKRTGTVMPGPDPKRRRHKRNESSLGKARGRLDRENERRQEQG